MSDKKEEAKDAPKEEEKTDDKKDGEANAGSQNPNAKGQFRTIINTTKSIEKFVTNSEDEKAFYETVRRWKVIIKEIYVISQKRFDCFLNFTVGGDLRIDTFKIVEKNRSGKIVHGARGYSEFTELQEILDINTRVKFEKEMYFELRDSIISLSKQNLVIECWDYNSFKLNIFQGLALVDLMKIIRGSVYQSAIIIQKVPTGEGGFINKPLCKVEFQIFFQEIWDFVLSFEDWRATNLNYAFNVDTKQLQPSIDFKLSNGNIKSTVSQKASANPQWSAFNGSIKYRGTLSELENQSLQINIQQNESTIIKRNKISRVTDLKGITANGIIKDFLPQKINKKKKEDVLFDSILIGKINVNTIPKYNQISHETFINLDQIYVCLYMQKLTLNQIPNFCKLPTSTFITVEFNGKTYESSRVPIQINDKKFNQYMYFLLGTPDAKKVLGGSLEKRLADIVSHLTTKNEIFVKLWIEDSYKCLDYIGKFEINITDIFEKGKLMERKYKSMDNSEIIYKTKVFAGEEIFESSYEVNDVRLKYDLWLYPEEYTKNIELPKEGIKKKFKENPIIEKASEVLSLIEEEFLELKRNFRQTYQDYQNRFFDFFEALGKEGPLFSFQDENKNFRIINSYLSKLTIKNQECDEIFFTSDIEKIMKKKNLIEKIMLPLDNEKAMVHYIKCLRYSQASDHIVLSPEYFMQTKKGSKFEHAILLSCLLMNIYSMKKDDLEVNKKENTDATEDNSKTNESSIINKINNNSLNSSKNLTLPDNKTFEGKPLIDKTKDNSMLNLEKLSEKDFSLNTTKINISNAMTSDEKELDKTNSKLDTTSRSIDNLIKNTKNNIGKNSSGQIPHKRQIDGKIIKKLIKKKDIIAFDNSDLVFVCFGTLKGDKMLKSNLHMWVMTFSQDFKDVTFWEPMNNKKYVLKDRITYDEIMKQFFFGEFETKEDIEKALTKLRKAAKSSKDAPKHVPNKNQKDKKQLPQMLNQEEDIDTTYIKHKPEDILSEIKLMETHINIQRGYRLTKSANSNADDEYMRANNLNKKVKIGNEEDQMGKNENNSYTFDWKENYKKTEIINEVLPYRTIDVIFNKKNIYVNKQHPNPSAIYYDLYDSSKWYMVLKTTQPEMDSQNFQIWREDIPSFYSFKNFQPNYTDEDLEGLKKNILLSLASTIRNMRSQSNATTFFKTNRETRDMLDIYLIFLEMKEVGVSDNKDHKKKMKEWSKYFKEKLTHKTTIEINPLFFNYANDGLICNYVEENMGHFVQKSRKDSYFVLSCKIFQYPNRVLSVRVVMANFYKSDNEIEKLNAEDDENAMLINNGIPLSNEL